MCKMLSLQAIEANRNVQRTLSLVYLKAASTVLPGGRVIIENSLSKGLYTMIRGAAYGDAEVAAIEEQMHRLIRADLPIQLRCMSKAEAAALLKKGDHAEKLRLLELLPEGQQVRLYELDGYFDFFYGEMLPATGTLPPFELRRYRKGVLLRFPEPSAPHVVPPYTENPLLYDAFAEAVEWNRILGIEYVPDLWDAVREGRTKEIIQLSEALQEKSIARIADRIKEEKRRIVLIAGPSSSGKTSFANRLIVQMKVNGLHPLYLGTDDYFVERTETPIGPDGKPNYEDLDCLDLQLFQSQMNSLLAGERVDMPSYNFLTGKKEYGKRFVQVEPNAPIVIEGIHGLNPALTADIPEEQKFKIYISPLTQLNIDNHNRIPTTDARMLRRIVRDSQFRNYPAAHTIDAWPSVRAGEDKNIFPFANEADAFFNTHHAYELGVMRAYAEPLLQAITIKEPQYPEAQRLLQFLRFFPVIDQTDAIPNNSILREFIGGSIFFEE